MKFKPTKVFIKLLLVAVPVALLLTLTGSGFWLLRTDSGAAWLWSQVEEESAGAVSAASVEGNLAAGLVIRNLIYHSDSTELSVNTLKIQAVPGWWPVSVQLEKLTLEDVLIVSQASEEPAKPISADADISSVLAALDLPVPVKIHAASISNISLQQGENTPEPLLDSIRFKVTLERQLVVEQLQIEAAGVSANLSGNLQLQPPFDLAATLEGRVEVAAQSAGSDLNLPFSVVVSGPIEDWSFELVIDLPLGQAQASRLLMSGIGSSKRLVVQDISVSGTDLNFDIEANIDLVSSQLSAELGWSQLNWPLFAAKADFSSPSGHLTVAGRLDEWTAEGLVEVQIGEYPQGSFEIQADGNRSSARLAILKGEVLGGIVSGEARADWSDDLNWSANIHAKGINPKPLFTDWPGQLDAELEIAANALENQTRINVAWLKGRVRDLQLNARGGFSIGDDGVSFENVEVRTDKAVLMLDGNAAQRDGITLVFNGEIPSVLLQGASGSIEAQGRYSSQVDGPVLELRMAAQELDWNGYHIKTLSVSSAGSGAIPEIQLDATDVRLPEVLFDSLSLDVNPVGDKHRLTAEIFAANYAFSSELILAPEHKNQPFSGNWRGEVKDMNINIGQSFVFSLNETAGLQWSPQGALLGPLCLSESAGAKLCISGDYQAAGGWSMSADVAAIPFDYLRDLFELDLHFEQTLEGRMEWKQTAGGAPTGGAEMRITAGKIIDTEDNEILAETREGRFAFALQNGNLESGAVDLEFVDTGFIDVDFAVMDIVENSARMLQGRAFVQLDNIRMLGQLALPWLDEIDGHFESTLALGGTLTEPEFDGGFKLTDGLVEYAPIGLRLEEIEFEGQVEKLDRGSFKGKFRAGEGIGLIDGRFAFKNIDAIQLDVDFSGEQLLLINTDELKLRTDSDLRLGLSPGQIDINGYIRIPTARFSPAHLYLGGVSDSEDLIIEPIDGAVPTKAAEENSSARIFGELELTFGDDVLIELPGIETSFSGTVMFNWNGEPLPSAQGRYVLDGTVDVYGPKLQISQGQISFPGVPADNPVLNIRAEREIYGNTQIRSAGVQVIGSLKRPALEAYTVPVTNEDRAWTILITGSDFDQGQGVGGFDVGTYIAPKLYVSYGVSLFEDENVVSARYDLRKGFGVKVTSGQRETGLDVSYTIDK